MANFAVHAGTYSEYKAKKEASGLVATDLYFITDAPQRLFRGENPVNEAFVLVDVDPTGTEDMMAGVLYINKTTGVITTLNADEKVTIMPARVTSIDDGTPGENIPTVSAIKTYVETKSTNAFTKAEYVASESDHVHALKFTTSGGTTSFVDLPSGLANAEYNPSTGTFTFTKYDGTQVTADTPLEKVLTDASYDPQSHKLSLTFNVNGEPSEPIDVDLSGLVDTFTVTKASESAISVSSLEGQFTIGLTLADASLSQTDAGLKVAISAEEGNMLSLAADGLKVIAQDIDLSGYVKSADLASTEENKGAKLIGVHGTYAAGDKTVEGVLTDHETRIGTAESDITALEGRMDTVEGKLTTLEGQIETAEGELTTLKETVSGLDAALTWKTI